jgi:hypothetical protein
MTEHEQIRMQLDDFIDGTLAEPERVRVAAHLDGCPACRADVEAVQALLAEAGRLPRSIQPTSDLWGGIEHRLVSGSSPARRRFRTVYQVAAALGFLLLGAALATAWHSGREPAGFRASQARYAAASAALAEQLTHNPAGLSPATRAVVERNLAIVDAAISEAESALSQDPGNPALEQMLVARYEQRLGLLRRATRSNPTES